MDRMVMLSVGTFGDDDYASTFQDISELARNLGASHTYVNVSASVVGVDDEPLTEDCDREHLDHDENTLVKARQALARCGLKERDIDACLNEMQNAGILFRERR